MHNNYWLVDGYTRCRAYLIRGKTEIEAYVGLNPKENTSYGKNEIKVTQIAQ